MEAFALLAALKARGNLLSEPRSSVIETGLLELRGHQVRIFYMFRPGRRIVLLDGMIKKRDAIPREVLDRVRGFKRDLERREQKPS